MKIITIVKKLVRLCRRVWRQIELGAARRGIRIPLFKVLTIGRKKYRLDFKSVQPDQENFNSLCKRYKISQDKASGIYDIVIVTSENVDRYIKDLMEVEVKSFPEDFRGSEGRLLYRFRVKGFREPVCYLYFRDGKPIAYSLGMDLEFFDPFDYGLEIGLHPEYLRFTTFYIENISVVPEERQGWLTLRLLLDIIFGPKRKGYTSIVSHSRIDNGTMDIAIKLGFKHLMVHKQFLGANIDASFNWLNLQGLVETGALASSEGA